MASTRRIPHKRSIDEFYNIPTYYEPNAYGSGIGSSSQQASPSSVALGKRRKLSEVSDHGSMVVNKLPPELWQEVASLLPLDSRGALALTCRQMYGYIGHEVFAKYRSILKALRKHERRRRRSELLAEQEERLRKGKEDHPWWIEAKKLRTMLCVGHLPTTVWLNVASYLPLSDQACLAISCSYLHDRLKTQPGGDGTPSPPGVLQKLKTAHQWRERNKFLFRAFDFFPDTHEFCEECSIYHLQNSTQPHSLLSEIINVDEGIGNVELTWDGLQEMNVKIRGKSAPQIATLEIDDMYFESWEVDAFLAIHKDKCLIFWFFRQYITSRVLQKPSSQVHLPILCKHDASWSMKPELKSMLNKVPRPWQDFDSTFELQSMRYQCGFCPTEAVMHISDLTSAKERADHGAKYVTEIVSVMDIGSGYTTHSREWAALVKENDDYWPEEPLDIGSQQPLLERYKQFMNAQWL